jgi:PAS domain S-box-containing protein
MSEKRKGADRRHSLRAKAEALVVNLSPSKATAQPNEILTHELLVHKVELEMQNEELRRAYTSMEEARDRYVNFYEFAPVGYITLSRDGLISEINLTGSTLLGIERFRLIGRRFTRSVVSKDKDLWYRVFLNLMDHSETGKRSFDLEMERADHTTFHAHLDCLRWEVEGAPKMLRIALTDISNLKQVEAELRISAQAFESQQPMLITDANKIILRVNKAFTQDTGFTSEEVAGHVPGFLNSDRHPPEFLASIWSSINHTGSWHGAVWNQRKNGEFFEQRVHITAAKNDFNEITHYIFVFSSLLFSATPGG